MRKIIIGVVALGIVVAFLIWKFGPPIDIPLTEQPITLTYWGLWEEENLVKPLLEEYQKAHPKITVNYIRQSSINYRTRVQTQIKAGSGPDVFMIHSSWIPMFRGDLLPAPTESFTLADYQNTFYPLAVNNFVVNNQILSAPMEIDGLALFYNEDIINPVGVQVPRNWQEFVDGAVKVTVRDASGKIQTAGAAMGSTANIDNWSDILGLLLLQQPGIDLKSSSPNIATPAVAEVMRFYTGFITDSKRKTWDTTLPSSTEMFASGRLAFYIAPSWRAHELRQMNPNLKFKVTSVPQLAGQNVGWGTFWSQSVSAKSKHPKQAWDFINFLTSASSQRLMYQTESQIRLFGEPFSRMDLASTLSMDPIVGAFVLQGPIYKGWYLNSNTMDAGINDEMIKYFEDGVNTVLKGTDPQIALQTVEAGARQILDKYTKSQAQTMP